VGFVIGKGGETIKSMQAKSGARIQVCYLVLQLPVLPPSVIGNKVSLSLLVCFPAFFLLYQVNLNAGRSR